jgi:hypothetical protein
MDRRLGWEDGLMQFRKGRDRMVPPFSSVALMNNPEGLLCWFIHQAFDEIA